MKITTRAAAEVPGEIAEVFAFCTSAEGAAEFFRGYGPIPAIRGITYREAGPARVGAWRDVELSDGSRLWEQIAEWDPPRRHVYRVGGFAAPLSWLAREGQGAWSFESRGANTRVVWVYEYTLTSPLAWVPAAVIVRGLMQPAMARAVRAVAAHFA